MSTGVVPLTAPGLGAPTRARDGQAMDVSTFHLPFALALFGLSTAVGCDSAAAGSSAGTEGADAEGGTTTAFGSTSSTEGNGATRDDNGEPETTGSVPEETGPPLPTEQGASFDAVDRAALYVPAGSGPHPVIFAFHGAGDTGTRVLSDFAGGPWRSILDREQIILVALDADGPARDPWTYPKGQPNFPFTVGEADDHRVRRLLGRLEQGAEIDRTRVYAIGFSMGATMSAEVGFVMDDLFASTASVGQGLPPNCTCDYPDHWAPQSGYQAPALLMGDPADPPFATIRFTEALLTEAGHPFEVQEFPGTGHLGSWTASTIGGDAPARVWGWLDSRRHP